MPMASLGNKKFLVYGAERFSDKHSLQVIDENFSLEHYNPSAKHIKVI